jgi:hypothetical protein
MPLPIQRQRQRQQPKEEATMTNIQLFQINQRPILDLSAPLRGLLPGTALNHALQVQSQLFVMAIRVTTDVVGGVLYSIIHQVVGRVVVVEECPGAENSIGPRCLGSGL